MRKIDQLLSEYGESHQNPTNKLIHWVCVPAIFFSVIGLIWSIPSGFLNQITGVYSPFINWATIVGVLALLYYFSLSKPLFMAMVFVMLVFFSLSNFIDQSESLSLFLVSVSVFIISWIVQFYGHKIEGKKPSFFKDVQFLLIGPLWLTHFIFKKLGLSY
ncbi:MAG: Mpo1-like protein [Bacteroidota bacterium]